MKSCFYCKGPVRQRRIEHMHRWGGDHYLFKNVPAEVCGQCGEVFLSPATLRRIDRAVKERKPDGSVSVPVFSLKSRAA